MKAFPSIEPIYSNNIIGVKQSTGMDLRDYFAGRALQGLLTRPVEEFLDEMPNNYKNVEDYAAYISYAMADAMMKAREK
jgi:hypothetical protein